MSYQKTIFKSILILNIFRGQSLSHTQKHLRTWANAAARRPSKIKFCLFGGKFLIKMSINESLCVKPSLYKFNLSRLINECNFFTSRKTYVPLSFFRSFFLSFFLLSMIISLTLCFFHPLLPLNNNNCSFFLMQILTSSSGLLFLPICFLLLTYFMTL